MKKIHKNLLFYHDGFPYCQFLSIDHHILFRLLAHFPSSDAPRIRSTLTRHGFLLHSFPIICLILPRLGSVASSTNLNISPANCCADQTCASDPFLKRKETTSSSYSHSNRHSREAAHGPMHMCHLSQFTGNQPAVYQRTNQPTRCPSSPFLSTAA